MRKAVVIGLAVVLVIAIFFAIQSNSNATGNYLKLDPTGNVAGTGLTVTQNPTNTGETKEFTMTANEFAFVPETITVNEGDKVVLYITSVDVDHGISIPEFDVSENLPVGKTTTVEFIADKKGTYSFFCNVFCGEGHKEMTGTLVVN